MSEKPSQLVVDCSVAAKWVLSEPGRDLALQLLEQYESGEVLLIAPDLLLAEFASLLAKRNRRKEISADQAVQALDLMGRYSPKLFDTHSRLRSAFELSLHYQLSLWDSVYLALAIEHNCPLITADERLFRGAVARHSLIRPLR